MSLYREIKSHQKGPEKSGYLMYYVYRKISVFFSIFFIKLRISPNTITFLSLVSDGIVVYLMYLQKWIIAGLLVNLALILDCSDGEVARYYRSKEKNPTEKKYGSYLDEVLGTIGFTAVVFFAGYFMGKIWLGLFAMFGLFMVILTSLTAQIEFPQKKEIAKKFEEGLFGNRKGRIGFTCAAQRILVSLGVIFSSIHLLFLFGVLCHTFYLFKFWIYRKL